MGNSYDLTTLQPDTFEHMVNALALAVLGAGATGFGPGSDAGRDCYFEGEAPYPSSTERWDGIWYIQSKFHTPHLSKDPQKWLLEQIRDEIKEFTKHDTKRKWPNNWIIATNIDQSGKPETGAFDRAKALVKAARPALEPRFHIWGGAKICNFLSEHGHIAKRYAHFLTPGDLLTAMMENLRDDRADVDSILQQLVVRKFKDQRQTKLEQAGSQSDVKPAIHDLFVDIPFRSKEHKFDANVMEYFTCAGNEAHEQAGNKQEEGADWRLWSRHPRRACVWFLRGGPGNGKSTVGQYFCQIQRSALMLSDSLQKPPVLKVHQNDLATAREVQKSALRDGFWPLVPRIPLHVELKDYAQWYGGKKNGSKGVLSFVAEQLTNAIEQTVKVGTLKRALTRQRWVAVFDGLDEVPEDVKDSVAAEVTLFITQVSLEASCDLLSLCTSRPQGYSGQFRELESATVDLLPLPTERALACARPVISYQRSVEESNRAISLLESSANSPSIRELLTTPLQAHILAVVVRDGERPPDRRWKLYSRFYDVIRRREANRNLPDAKLARLLGGEEKLLKTLHNRVGFRLQADAETSQGAETSLAKDEFRTLAFKTVSQMVEDGVDQKVELLDKATTERLVLINTPENGTKLRFDIRQLQEFFAAECLYDSVKAQELRSRIAIIAGDAHWREVMHFLLSSLVENDRSTELSVAIDELRRLNEGDAEEDRLLTRRAGKGALLAARLLSEGVLEQDKAVRQSFRECLAPMAGFAQISRLASFLTVRQDNSKAWLLSFLIDKLRESANAENIGAAIVLAHILPDSDLRVPEVQQHLMKASGSYINAIIDSLDFEDENEVPSWFISVLMRILTKPNWGETGANVIGNVLWFLRRLQFRRLVENTDLPSQFHPLLQLLLLSGHQRPSEQQFSIGGFTFAIPKYDESANRIVATAKTVAIEGDAPGILSLVQQILTFSEISTRANYCVVLDSLCKVDEDALLPIISAVQFPMPANPNGMSLTSLMNQISSQTDSEFDAMQAAGELKSLSSANRVVWEYGFHHKGGPVTADDLIACFEFSPQLALELIVVITRHQGLEMKEANNALTQLVESILPKLQADPRPLIAVPWSWHILITHSQSRTPILPKLICDACRAALPYRRIRRHSPLFHRFGDSGIIANIFAPFNQCNDPVLLPFLADLILSHLRVFGGIGHNSNTDSLLPSNLIQAIEQAQETLVAISRDNRLCPTIRFSAALLQFFNSGANTGPTALSALSSEFVTNCNSIEGEWLIEGLVTVLTMVDRKPTAATSKLLGELFESRRLDYSARAALEQVLVLWRELSSAPITTQGLRDRWLYRS